MNKKHKETKKAIRVILKYLKKHHSSDSIAYNDKTPIYISYSRSEAGKISYITERKLKSLREHIEGFKINNETRKKHFFHTTPLKFFRKFYSVDACGYKYEEKIADLAIVLFSWENMKLRKVAPVDIPQLYKNADVVGSCMQGKPLEYLELYTKLQSGGAYAIELGGEIVGRFLYHTQNRGGNKYIYIDRIYLNTDNNTLKSKIYEKIYDRFLKSYNVIQGFNICHLSPEYRQKSSWIKYGGFVFIQLTEDCSNLDKYPYLDTYKYLDADGLYLYRAEDADADKILDCTDGGFTDYEARVCECCGARIDEDEDRYCEDVEETRCSDCAVWSDTDNCYYAEENCTYIRGNIDSYVHNDDIG